MNEINSLIKIHESNEQQAPSVQMQAIPEEEELLQGKMIENVQRQETPEEEPLQTKKKNNTGMPDNLKAGVENLSGSE
ncbi:hypothetical protein [Methanosarcina barkeri]|uniref:hypothetical protein n=1 Tax=Methanosarcina barkeri TaxID=2208 RepID=UPI000693E295|nr:hypothetical protein [Methanosarcina barkeri]